MLFFFRYERHRERDRQTEIETETDRRRQRETDRDSQTQRDRQRQGKADLAGANTRGLTPQQNASVSQGWISTDNCTCCHTETEVADQPGSHPVTVH